MNDLEFQPQADRFVVQGTTSSGGSTAAFPEGSTGAVIWARWDARTLAEYAAGGRGNPVSPTAREPDHGAAARGGRDRAQIARVVIVPRADIAGDDDVAASFARWGEAGRAALTQGLAGAKRGAAASGERLVIWPRLGTLVSDIPGVLNLIRGHEAVGVLFDPVALIAPDSIRFAADFLKRAAEVIEHASGGIDAVYVPREMPVGVADADVIEAAARAAGVRVCRGPRVIQ